MFGCRGELYAGFCLPRACRGVPPKAQSTATISLGCVSPRTSSSLPTRLRPRLCPACGGTTPWRLRRGYLGLHQVGFAAIPHCCGTVCALTAHVRHRLIPSPFGAGPSAVSFLLHSSVAEATLRNKIHVVSLVPNCRAAPLPRLPGDWERDSSDLEQKSMSGSNFSFLVFSLRFAGQALPATHTPETGIQMPVVRRWWWSGLDAVRKSRLETGIWRLVSGVVSGRSSTQCPVPSFRYPVSGNWRLDCGRPLTSARRRIHERPSLVKRDGGAYSSGRST